jgi:hypothetical protein
MKYTLKAVWAFAATLISFGSLAGEVDGATFIVPTASSFPYLQFSDSPFAGVDFSGGYFHLETFEDDLLNTPGATASGGSIIGVEDFGGLVDSVDADDGVINGIGTTGNLGRSYFGSSSTFNFSAALLGNLPTHAGIVWTDGSGLFSIEAFDENGVSLGSAIGISHADGSISSTTAEDRFYGVTHPSGISRIILISGGSLETDHLQYGFSTIPEPSSAFLLLSSFALCLRRRTSRLNDRNG